MKKLISFSRHVDRVWLEFTLSSVAHGASKTILNQKLEHLLESFIATVENRRKARNLLVSIWAIRENTKYQKFDCDALDLYLRDEQSTMSLQWGMLVARKPFFAAVARYIGRYSKLNDCFKYAQVNKRMCELFGETESTSRATRAVLKTMQELGALVKNDDGSMSIAAKVSEQDKWRVNWMLKALLLSDNQESREFHEVQQDPVWFPFQLSINESEIDTHLFEVHQQGNSLYLFLKQDVE
ncbi:hypothetical protein [Shewanella sp. GXUN23E]|uniref:hypothetical protein n=1 Tax=Shewanella sp. GXUN23E TaxID=3422498 RepID=UPI003D7EEC79